VLGLDLATLRHLGYLAPKLERNPTKPVILRTDPRASYGAMVAVYDELRQGRHKLGLTEEIRIALPTEREVAQFSSLFRAGTPWSAIRRHVPTNSPEKGESFRDPDPSIFGPESVEVRIVGNQVVCVALNRARNHVIIVEIVDDHRFHGPWRHVDSFCQPCEQHREFPDPTRVDTFLQELLDDFSQELLGDHQDELAVPPSPEELLGRAGRIAAEEGRDDDVGVEDCPQPVSHRCSPRRWRCPWQ
jgi:hypothetical protein